MCKGEVSYEEKRKCLINKRQAAEKVSVKGKGTATASQKN